MTDITARLDAAITEERSRVLAHDREFQRDALDRYTVLVAVRARLEEHGRAHYNEFEQAMCGRCPELTAEAERLREDA